MAEPETLTRLLQDWRAGDAGALERLTPMVYESLRRLGRRYLQGERPGHTMQATDLVHEAFLELMDAAVDFRDRAHFFALAARQMRRLLVDHARARRRDKRGGGALRVTLDEACLVTAGPGVDLLDLDQALQTLAGRDARKAQVLEMHFFGGMTYEETAAALGISAATVDRELRFAKAWVARALAGG